jgi:DNA-directed RNA polymerase specialized sigma24 family protein
LRASARPRQAAGQNFPDAIARELVSGSSDGLSWCDRWLRDRGLSDPVIEEILLKLWSLQKTQKGTRRLAAISSWPRFLRRLARNARQDVRRSEAGRGTTRIEPLRNNHPSSADLRPDQIADIHETVVAVLRALPLLSPNQGVAVIATRVLGESYLIAARRIYGERAGHREEKRVAAHLIRGVAALRRLVPGDLTASRGSRSRRRGLPSLCPRPGDGRPQACARRFNHAH